MGDVGFIQKRAALCVLFFFSSRRRHTRCSRDWSSDVCSSDLGAMRAAPEVPARTATPILRGLHETARYARSTRPIAAILMLVALVTLLGRPYTEIGRASCRERV